MVMIHVKNFLNRKGNNQVKRQLAEWEEIFASFYYARGFAYIMYKEHKNLIKNNHLIQTISE